MRAGIYGVMSLIQWLSIIVDSSSLIVSAIFLLAAGVCYALAGLKHQDFVGSKTLGGQGVYVLTSIVVLWKNLLTVL